MANGGYSFKPTDSSDELFMADVPIDIILGSIENQFNEPFVLRKNDHVKSFITKYDWCKENTEDPDALADLEDTHRKFFGFMERIFEEKLSIGFPDIDDLNDEDLHDLIYYAYRFFIRKIKPNFVWLVINYIEQNEEFINDHFEKKKDITALNFKNEVDNEYDVLVLSNLGDIITYILNEAREYDVPTFLNLCDSDECRLELEAIKAGYENAEITGNFINQYIDMLDPEFLIEIQCKVRTKILKKYPKRTERKENPVNKLVDDMAEYEENQEDEN